MKSVTDLPIVIAWLENNSHSGHILDCRSSKFKVSTTI